MWARLARLLRDRGFEPDEVGSSADLSFEPTARVPYASVDEAIERSAARLEAADLGLALATVRDDEAYGAAGLLLAASSSLRRGLKRAFAYQRLWGDGDRFALREEADGLVVTFQHPGASRLAGAVLAECALAEVMLSARVLVRSEASALRVGFAHAPLGRTDALARHFGVRPSFGQPENAIVLEHALVDAPLVLRRELLQTVFEQQCRQALDRLPSGATLAEHVRGLILDRLDSPPAMSNVAARFRMSVRTLQRKLDAEGTSFQRVVDAVRRTRAGELAASGSSLKKTAFELGYSDPSGFLRARRRWRD